jgi:hypothetical protein
MWVWDKWDTVWVDSRYRVWHEGRKDYSRARKGTGLVVVVVELMFGADKLGRKKRRGMTSQISKRGEEDGKEHSKGLDVLFFECDDHMASTRYLRGGILVVIPGHSILL